MDPLPSVATWITLAGMALTAVNTALAGIIVYMTARDKLRYDLDKQALTHRIQTLESELARYKAP